MTDINEHGPRNWEHPDVYQYEKTIPLKIPGYEYLYELTNRLLNIHRESKSAAADILIVGAGGGQECVALGAAHGERRFTGVDPSARMLEIAELRAEKAGMKDRVTLIQGSVECLPSDRLYDAATCMLVLHFIQGLPAKRNILHQIAERLKPGAPLFLSSINGEPGTSAFDLQMRTWVRHMQDNGVSPEETDRFMASFGSVYDPVPAAQVLELLKEAGFEQSASYFGSYLIDAWVAIRIKE
ncbi:tRNA (cmo5U34)-methyltransferase [Aneurinibacillus soli]|uniref:Bifunctional 3-demethylubiquinone-9 3-methyltransferase/ 2-octaprenyl-6-hydroxy phenol methylase n=1 Tax=Aneurinibacillus soli TaxID=1500254 RepID=A0A0U5BDF7_9BACL|nr:class I SAM-dependent methyltransferase [Aneurinibacillus soli]PYE62937.1 tRNA (cmo5U34)-methyltransferase [Aneurinibacillus soli]BAU29004.1 bifunctional 3-demethylubiquinone-9 3-methyltransferase/ 2-octaprenyl-6-hydroxy phenol methylase [Aneurinibacillus soli]